MKAAIRHRYGGPEVVHVEDVDRPVPAAGEVLVRVRAASVNRADLDSLYPRWQFTRLFLGVRRPKARTPGIDMAGVVEEVGTEVSTLKPGDRVFAELFRFTGDGTFAEYVIAQEESLARIPHGLSDSYAAALPHSGGLAMQALRHSGGRTVRPGERLMMVGASGNVGPYVVQIAKARGAYVTGVASGSKLDFVRALGADDVVDYQTEDPTRPAEPYDWIVDADAHSPIIRWRRALRPGGVYVALGGSVAWLLSGLPQTLAIRLASSKRMGLLLGWKPFSRPDIDELLELVLSGKVEPAIDRTFTLDEVVAALRWVDEGKARGKVLVIP